MSPQSTTATSDQLTQVTSSFVETIIPNKTLAMIIEVIVALGIIVVLVMISKFVASAVKNKIIKSSWVQEGWHVDQIAELVSDIVFYCLVIFSVFVGFEILWFDVGLILWWVSFGIWLAFKEVLGNMIAGIMILSTREISLWDTILVKDKEEYFGIIEEITIRYTVIRTLERKQVIIPNLTLITAPIQTFSAEEQVRITTTVEVHYRTDLEKATSIALQAIQACQWNIAPDQSMVLVNNLGESWIELKCYLYIDPNAWLLVDQAIWYTNQTLKARFDANDIIIPYPHVTITKDRFVPPPPVHKET